ncbi:MAG TPA: DNA-3-methyladenine glycosylase, partial [Actinomycetota bacterium]|nr:DNA-3-methyladenine glycosylase [Actinomycetota bacterium]
MPRSFYGRPSATVARDLVGRLLVGNLGGALVAGRIVECEAYQEDDPASHSFRGPTARNQVMFGPPGRLYVYVSYGVHHCMNVVTGARGSGSAVLLRAVEPLDGLEAMAARRGEARPRLLCSGPGRLTQAYGVGRDQNGLDLVAGTGLWVAAGRPVRGSDVRAGPRVGIRAATERPWRFVEAGSPFVSRGPVSPRRTGSATASATGAAKETRGGR